jgi:hypothetical protein
MGALREGECQQGSRFTYLDSSRKRKIYLFQIEFQTNGRWRVAWIDRVPEQWTRGERRQEASGGYLVRVQAGGEV